MRQITMLAAALALFTLGSAAASDGYYHWRVVGADPYSCDDCTLEWALAQSGYPAEVQEALTYAVEGDYVSTGQVCAGDVLDFMTFGRSRPKVTRNVLADWPAQQCEPADEYKEVVGEVEYTLVRVHRCGNWGGRQRTFVAPLPEPAPAIPSIVLGMIPETECQAGSAECGTCE